MKTLERQLADYGERQRELHGVISPDELAVTLSQPDQKAPLPPHRRKGLWIAVTASVATLVVFGLIPLLVNTDTSASVADTVVPPNPNPILLAEGFAEFVGGLEIPNDLEFDPSGAIFVSESGAGRVIKVEILPDGSSGDSVVVVSGLADAEGLALSDDGVLYVSGESVVYRVVDGVGMLFAGEFHDPEGLAIDANGDLYVAHDDESGIRITKVTVLPDGTAGESADVAIVPGNTAADIDFGPDGKLFVANDLDAVWVIDLAEAGEASSRMFAMIPGGTNALAFDQFGILYAASEAEGTVWVIDQAGQTMLLADGFGYTEGLVVDASGMLYISTWSTNQVLRGR